MGYERIKAEHAGPKNGGGAWMTRAEAKQTAKRERRQVDKRTDECGDLDEFSARGSTPMLDDSTKMRRRLGVSWEEGRRMENEEPEMTELPESWRTMPDGTPAPHWVAALDEARRGR